jgi:two-component system, chemotaxis family, response regulator PixH
MLSDFVKALSRRSNPLAISTILCYFIHRGNGRMPAKQKTIIVVEDEQDAAEMFAEMMRLSGFRVLKTAGSGQAMSMIDKEEPAAVNLDIMMPDISGLQVLRYMRREPKLAKIPAVVVSAKSMPADIQTGSEAGASLYLTKPVGYLDLKDALEKVLGA